MASSADGTSFPGTCAINCTNGQDIGTSPYPYPSPYGTGGTGETYSFHSGGANVVLGDGSVRFANEAHRHARLWAIGHPQQKRSGFGRPAAVVLGRAWPWLRSSGQVCWLAMFFASRCLASRRCGASSQCWLAFFVLARSWGGMIPRASRSHDRHRQSLLDLAAWRVSRGILVPARRRCRRARYAGVRRRAAGRRHSPGDPR